MGRYDRLDRFNVEGMNEAEHKKKLDYVTKLCKCQACPTYVKGDNPVGYCFPLIGTSKKIQWEKDCICSTCAVYKEYELDHTHYCTRCSQFCQTMKIEGVGGQGGSG